MRIVGDSRGVARTGLIGILQRPPPTTSLPLEARNLLPPLVMVDISRTVCILLIFSLCFENLGIREIVDTGAQLSCIKRFN